MSRVEDLLVPGLNTSDLYRMTPQAGEHFGDNVVSNSLSIYIKMCLIARVEQLTYSIGYC